MTSVLPTSTFAVDFHRVFVGSQVWLIVRLAAGLMVWLCSGPISFAGEKKPTDPPSNAESLELSRSRNLSACVICHQPAGQGVPSIYPPLAESGWVNGPSDRLVAKRDIRLGGSHRSKRYYIPQCAHAQLWSRRQLSVGCKRYRRCRNLYSPKLGQGGERSSSRAGWTYSKKSWQTWPVNKRETRLTISLGREIEITIRGL